ncbi:CPP1-like family protein [Thermocoleostomius sinensis]|uniref:CPP1-like family protein n=1 Tax=Thermocoleostomius sinensis A174 TaxID=2016057 RepID=A0A9E8ZJA8_9CYAN|nr:CPP1-like family protein [Thermocoleostomius sinensis]WAL59531.1 CPP1-like family protein [Thermocoleostomius sinensis A174]
MSDKSPYERLGVNDESSFDEIQEARNRLVEAHSGDRKEVEAIEAAYDAILMDRLRLRQEGKIKVPDRIRFAERRVEPPTDYTPPPTPQTPNWFQRLVDTPSRTDVLLPAGLFLGTSLLSFVVSPAFTLAVGVGFSVYFLARKENKLGRAFLLTFLGLILGVVIGLQLGMLLLPQLPQIPATVETVAAIITFLVLWVISSFLR